MTDLAPAIPAAEQALNKQQAGDKLPGNKLHSAIYTGWISHQRLQPKLHGFRYQLFMLYLDLDELPYLFKNNSLWSYLKPNCAYFRRQDYLGPADQPLDQSVRDLVETHTGQRPLGRIGLLTHCRYWGICFNPVSFYYCHDSQGELQAIVSHITNTPWKEQFAYVHEVKQAKSLLFKLDKNFHVSPFIPMDIDYQWQFSAPGDSLSVHMQNWREQQAMFFATLKLERQPWQASSLNRMLFSYPWMTLKVVAAIYWQALRLWLKRIPFYPHPKQHSKPGDES
jgi:uncharacterized protein